MCYNYEDMTRRGGKRAARENLANASMANEMIIDEVKNLFPGLESEVIPITTGIRENFIFGFLPDWAKSFHDNRTSFNCRSETITEKPMWAKPFQRGQRCLVHSSAFYETDRATKKRYRFSVKGKEEIFYAGIFNIWTDRQTGKDHKTFAIITTNANELVSGIHDRMPVILDAEAAKIWMDPDATTDALQGLFKHYASEAMEMIEVPKPPQKKRGGNELALDF